MRILLFLACVLTVFAANATDATMKKEKDTWSIAQGSMDDSGVAWARYTDEMDDIGWGKFWVSTNPEFPDEDQMYAAGYLEGYMTHKRILETFLNYRDDQWEGFPPKYKNVWPEPVLRYMVANEAYTRKKAEEKKGTDAFWMQVHMQIRLFDGILAGYNAAAAPADALNSTELWLLNSMGDMDDLGLALFLDEKNYIAQKTANADHHHCTGMVKIVKNERGFHEDVFVSHVTWSGYSTMNRMLKSYEFKLTNEDVKSRQVAFSSYPGVTFSNDDFYVTDTKLNILETTFHCWDYDLYGKYLTPNSVLTWIRTMVATRLAKNGTQWYNAFKNENSGTYNNQYLIVDHKLFDFGMKPKEGFVTCVEQMPGLMMSVDRTSMLLESHFVPSINVPSIIEVFNYAKYPEKIANTSNYWSYNDSARMHIIKRDQEGILNYTMFQDFMRYNNYLKDKECLADPAQSISARYDLRGTVLPLATARRAFGATDAKTTNHWDATRMRFDVIAGQTLHPDLPAFSYAQFEKETETKIPHRGIPDNGWPKRWTSFEYDSFGLGHAMSIWAILGIVLSVLVFLGIASWMGWSCKKKPTMLAFNPDLAQGAYAPVATEEH